MQLLRQLGKQPHWRESLHQMFLAAFGEQRWKLFGMFGLMGVNWALESKKWQIAMKPVQPIRFLRAFKAVLAGTCIASFTPNRVGEYLGRMLYVNSGNKLLSIAPTILCSMSQMLVTLIAGTVGIALFSFTSLLLWRFMDNTIIFQGCGFVRSCRRNSGWVWYISGLIRW